jgi:carbon-monoxide dehydrogenase large subunit
MQCDPAPLIHEGAVNNSSFTMSGGDGDMVEPASAWAHHVTRLSLTNNRVTAAKMEPRDCIAEYDPGTRRDTLYTSTQNVHGVRQTLARQILHVPGSRIRVIARDVDGGFGMKGQTSPEEAVLVWASRRIGRAVKWIPSRAEALLGGNHGRDQKGDAELAIDADGRFLALCWNGMHNAGAYIAAVRRRARPSASVPAAASSITSITPASSTGAWNCASAPMAN